MPRYILRALGSMPPTLIGVLTIVFLIVRLIPGDPAIVFLGDMATPEELARVRAQLHLNDPLPVQYARYVGGILRGDLGFSLKNDQPVARAIRGVYPFTVHLAVAALAVSAVIGVPLGVLSALNHNRPLDLVSMGVSLIGVCTPLFWLGILLLLLFSLKIPLFPAIGLGDPGDVGSYLRHLALPAFTLGLSTAALTARITRSSMLEVLGQDYVRTARAKGLAERLVIYRHALRNALIPIISIVGLDVTRMLGGSVIVESIFVRPGMGKLLVESIYERDYPQIQAVVLVFALTVIVVNVAVDMLYAVADPKIRYQ
ncbi:MAG: ABC transporter permease [Armatimonadetes bacterium]|nr:ABC transporter permease [Armatimonadota bacterium]